MISTYFKQSHDYFLFKYAEIQLYSIAITGNPGKAYVSTLQLQDHLPYNSPVDFHRLQLSLKAYYMYSSLLRFSLYK